WEWDDRLTRVFHLDPRARWQDGQSVTAADVAFTFDSYTDSLVNSPFRSSLRTISAVTTRDSLTAVFRFHARYPEMFYDAVNHMHILPAHLLRPVPRSQWRSAAFGRAPVGDGPYRFVVWKAGESVELTADSTFFLGRPHIRRLIWRFTPNLQVAVTQVIAGDADAVEVLGPPDNVKRAQVAANLALYPYRGELYGFLAFNLSTNGDTTKPHPLFGDRQLRRALAMAVDREGLRKSVWGDLPQVWTTAGRSNAGRYASPVFDRLVDQASAAPRRDAAKALWRRAIETLNQDAPAVFLYAPDNVAAVNRRVTDVVIRPDDYWALVRTWRIPADQLTDRDRAEP